MAEMVAAEAGANAADARANQIQNFAARDLTLDSGSAALAALTKLNQITPQGGMDDSDDEDE